MTPEQKTDSATDVILDLEEYLKPGSSVIGAKLLASRSRGAIMSLKAEIDRLSDALAKERSRGGALCGLLDEGELAAAQAECAARIEVEDSLQKEIARLDSRVQELEKLTSIQATTITQLQGALGASEARIILYEKEKLAEACIVDLDDGDSENY